MKNLSCKLDWLEIINYSIAAFVLQTLCDERLNLGREWQIRGASAQGDAG
jgi:hypothetical protein